MCGLPVQIDGSCNGLQHYSAIGRDKSGAENVNLINAEKPSDIYTVILEQVKEAVLGDADPANKRIATVIYPHLERKIIKQSVMTSVYGVTFIGTREQLAKQLVKLPLFKDEMLLHNASVYLAQKVMDAISERFADAFRIRNWLKTIAGTIARKHYPITWESQFKYSMQHLRFPIIQPYRANVTRRFNIGGHKIRLRVPPTKKDVGAE